MLRFTGGQKERLQGMKKLLDMYHFTCHSVMEIILTQPESVYLPNIYLFLKGIMNKQSLNSPNFYTKNIMYQGSHT